MKKTLSTLFSAIICCNLYAQFIWQGNKVQQVACAPNEHVMISTTLGILNHDSKLVLGDSITVSPSQGNIIVGTLGISPLVAKIDATPIQGKKEAFMLKVGDDHKLYIIGSDAHGTAYGIIELTRLLNVSPWEFWADVTPRKMDKLELPANYINVQNPTVEFRGIFINDEDWGLTRWNSRDYEPPYRPTRPAIGPDKTSLIFELLLRLRANTYWPPMHESNQAFFLTEGNREVAEKYGIYIGSSHCEPMATNPAVEWPKIGVGEYNFIANHDNVMKFWEDRVKDVNKQEIFYTIGMRGLHDWGMAGATTPEERKVALTQVIKEQRELLSKYVNPDVTKVPQMFIPYKEVLDVYNAGLEVPDDVTLMWPDDNFGYVAHFPTEKEKQRAGGNGIYYHVSYWGVPHDYLWLGTFSPALLYQQMNLAYDTGVQKIWILNVGDIKPIEYQTELFLDMAWNINKVRQEGVTQHLGNFLQREFGQSAGKELLPVMQEHYRLAYIHKPEHMGNTYVYFPVDKLEVNDLPWSENYIRQRMADYKRISDRAEEIGKTMPYDREDAYYHLVKYGVQATTQMNNKFLHAQLARHGKGSWKESDLAFDSIARLTSNYNYGIHNNGKWRRMMDMQPRKLPVFEIVPVTHVDTPLLPDLPVQKAWNGSEYSKGTGVAREALGYEGKAAFYPQNDKQYFEFGSFNGDSIHVRIAFVPGFPVNNQQSRLSISLDKQPAQTVSYQATWHSLEWCENVLFNQSIKEVVFKNDGKNKHTLTLQALDDGIVVDQIKIY